MKPIPVKTFFNITAPTEFKLHVARYNHVDEPLDVYMRNAKEWRGWNTWGTQRNIYWRDYIFSMIRIYDEDDLWLFGGTFRVIGELPKKRHGKKVYYRYEIKDVAAHSKHIGKVIIEASEIPRRQDLCLENYLKRMRVVDTLTKRYPG